MRLRTPNRSAGVVLAALLWGVALAAARPARAEEPVDPDPRINTLTARQVCNKFKDLYGSIYQPKLTCVTQALAPLPTSVEELQAFPETCRAEVRTCKRQFFPQTVVCDGEAFDEVRLDCRARVSLLDECFGGIRKRFRKAFDAIDELFTCAIFDPLAAGVNAETLQAVRANIDEAQAAAEKIAPTITEQLARPFPKACRRLAARCETIFAPLAGPPDEP